MRLPWGTISYTRIVPPLRKRIPERRSLWTARSSQERSGVVTLIFVDCEGHGPAPGLNDDTLFEFGAVEYKSRKTFHGIGGTSATFAAFEKWLDSFGSGRKVFVSDNPAYDWQFINFYFHLFFGHNPFGHSARRIGDFYAGLMGDFYTRQNWKKWRRTTHDHHPVHDAIGNMEAFETLIAMAAGRRT